jgi:outer membrane protein TolC
VLDLAQCLQLAHERQPALAVQRSSLSAAEDGWRALETLHVPTLLAPDLPVRRRQAALGVTAAAAGVQQAEREAVYAVIRNYFTVVYARAQQEVARGIVERLGAIQRLTRQRLEAGARDVTDTDVDRVTVYLELAQTQRVQAEEGAERGLAALKEAIGLNPGCCIDVAAGRLPEPELRLCKEQIVAWALASRAELTQAGVLAEVTGLEVEAQGTKKLQPRVQTFAAGGDIHGRQVRQGVHDSEYRPGAEPPEMPATLVGSRCERMQRAQSFNERAAAQLDKARILIALEAEDTFGRWHEAARKVPHSRQAAAAGERLAESLRKDFTASQRVRVDEVINAQVLASQARSQHNQILYQQLLALADLERATGGAFCAGLAAWSAETQPSPGTAARTP